jgi:hypothetical protein
MISTTRVRTPAITRVREVVATRSSACSPSLLPVWTSVLPGLRGRNLLVTLGLKLAGSMWGW